MGLFGGVIIRLWCHCCRSILIENLPHQITASSEAFEAPQQRDLMFPLCITEPVCGWLLQEMNNASLDLCVPVRAHVYVIIQPDRLNKTRHTALAWWLVAP